MKTDLISGTPSGGSTGAPRLGALAVLTATLAGCAGMPDLEVGYYLPEATVDITVTQTAACGDGNVAVVATDASIVQRYSPGELIRGFDLSEMGKGLTKTDAAFAFYPDGRLKSFNATQTGRAAEALAAAIQLVSPTPAPKAALAETPSPEVCSAVRQAVGTGKALTLVRAATIDFTTKNVQFQRKSGTTLEDLYINYLFGPDPTVTFGDLIVPSPPHVNGRNRGGQSLTLVEPAMQKITVHVDPVAVPALAFEAVVTVPQQGTKFSIPVQRGPWFGENILELELAESGRITKMRYSGDSGAKSAIELLGQAQAATAGETLSDQVARAKAEGDLIYYQQRAVICQIDPTNCPK